MYLFAKSILSKAVYSDMIKRTNQNSDSTFTSGDETMCLIILDHKIQKWAKEAKLKSDKIQGCNLKYVHKNNI